ncbi:hypothetical protein DFJ58DRAFT_717530 [Suillus subalutaceus]|uniref:uncharacterized protein n=1 Tax=Suillus subalutaceus TaxID=48586 RepID=UPI001B87A8F0|nr:uncharacterized protein DFJ58DRAFT_717530 [Suillus subalutaceus]KAG1845088.1 hypothetical protein DFJ58DRAFT_717530 [Suillus subalutaceus]
MATINPAPAASAQLPGEFKTEYHPRSGRQTLFQPFDQFGISPEAQDAPIVDKEPWRPFRSRGDFEFSEITIEAALNKSQINALLSLITHISEGHAQITLKNEADLSKAWDNAAAESTPFSKHEVAVTYKKNEQVYEVHARPIWDWALDLLDNPLLAPHFVWDACRVYKHNGAQFERFFDEPWTGDRWWDIQSSLPDINGAVPFCFILYADKTKLSSFGTVKGYPVVVRCANLLTHIQNGEAFGGGRIVGWLPIVPEDAGEEGKLGYTTLKRVVWHESFKKLLEHAAQYSKTGYSHKCHNDILRWLFPVILILSADYKEQCMMSLIRGRGGKCPCPVCLVPLEELHNLSKTHALRSIGEAMEALRVYKCSKAQEYLLDHMYLDPHDALSFDRLHSLHGGLWKHLLGELKKILALFHNLNHFAGLMTSLDGATSTTSNLLSISHFPMETTVLRSYMSLIILKQTLYACLNLLTPRTSPEGHQLLRVISTYLQLDSLIGLDVHTEGTLAAIEAELLIFDMELKAYVTCAESSDIEKLKLDWNFPKTHLWKHIVRDIRRKRAACNYSTRPNEKLHGPLKDTYYHQTNGKDVARQILCVDHHKFALMLLRERVDMVDEYNRLQALGDDLPDEDIAVAFSGHVKLGAPTQNPVSILDLENRSTVDRSFQAFQRKFTEFINTSLPTYGHQLTNWITFPADYQIHEHRYLKVNYESMVDWKQTTDHLRCNLQFPRAAALTADETIFVRLILLFRCSISNLGSFEFALVQPYTVRINGSRRMDHFFKLTRVKALPRASSIFVPLSSFIRGTILVPDADHQDEHLVVDHLDSDMFSSNEGLGMVNSTVSIILFHVTAVASHQTFLPPCYPTPAPAQMSPSSPKYSPTYFPAHISTPVDPKSHYVLLAYCKILCPATNSTITDLFLAPASPAYSPTSSAFKFGTEQP